MKWIFWRCVRFNILAAVVLSCVFLTVSMNSIGRACPFCDAPTTTFSEQLKNSHVAVLARWQSATRAEKTDFADGTTVYEILASGGAAKAEFPSGQTLTIDRYTAGRPEDECLLFATRQNEKLAWGLPLPISQECWTYLLALPSRDAPQQERLSFYLDHLEHADPEIAMDAYGEFAGVPYEMLAECRAKFSPEKLQQWLSDPLTIPTRKGLYGLMLGLCGTSNHVQAMAEILQQQPEDSRMGIDGMMAGYMLLTGEDGLKQLVAWKLNDPAVPDHETFAFLKALEFMWTYGQDCVSASLLRTTLRTMLSRPQLTGLVILDLARWQDWEVMDQLMASYGEGVYADSHVRQSIVRYLLAAGQNLPESGKETVRCRRQAQAHLETLRQKDPATVKYVQKYAFD